MKTYTIWSYGNLFTCTQTSTGITLTDYKDELVAEIDNITLPAEDDHEDTLVGFEVEVQNWLEDNYW